MVGAEAGGAQGGPGFLCFILKKGQDLGGRDPKLATSGNLADIWAKVHRASGNGKRQRERPKFRARTGLEHGFSLKMGRRS